MALLGNYSVLHKSPTKFMTGTIAYGDRANWNKPGMARSIGMGSGNNWKLAAIPQGFSVGGAWMSPRTAGGMTSRNNALLSFTPTASGALGRGGIAVAQISLDANALGQLIAGAIGSASLSLDATATIVAILAASGSALVTMEASVTVFALGCLSGNSAINLDATLISYAKGWMAGTTVETGALTPDAIAVKVWAALQGDIDNAGSAGAALLAAGSAGDPWSTALPGNYATGSAGALIKAIEKLIKDSQALILAK